MTGLRLALCALLTLLLSTFAHAQKTAMTHTYESFDGQSLTYTELGTGPVVLLLHGFTANAGLNWVRPGIAQKLADAGYRVIAPDFRGHGASQVPDSPQSWPSDALARDQMALLNHLGEEPHAVLGYSLGAITAVRLHLLSRRGGRLILGGVGDSLADEFNTDRNTAFRAAIDEAIAGEDTPGARGIAARAKLTGGTLHGFRGALSSRTYTPADLLATFAVPVLILTGDEDTDNGSGPALAGFIPGARHETLSGTHLSAVGDPAFPEKVIAFLAE